MGGKHKKANRTKNNERPSSSGRSAQFISNKVDPSLVMAGPGKLLPVAVFPTLGGNTFEKPLSNEFLLCFKKFHKKDSTTKMKAINELIDLVGKSEQAEVVDALSSWALYYPTLTVDIDRKVREVTQICHGEIVRKCGRQVALCIKKLLPPWLVARFDEYAPAQCVAESDLNATFPNDKLREAIKFCKTEIHSLLMDNLKNNTGYMLTGIKVDDEEEKKAQVARVTGCSLKVMKLFIDRLAGDHEDWLWDAVLPLLCANNYWRMVSHPDPFVRASWYMLTGGVVESFAGRLPRELTRRAARALLAHPERTPAVAAQRFMATLQLMRFVQDWPEHLDSNNLLIVRIVDVLENGGWGGAAHVAGLVVPLVSHLPQEMLTLPLYKQLFNAMFTGLGQKMLLCSPTETERWSEMIRDVAAFVSERHVRGGGAALGVELGAWAHRHWLRAALALPPLVRATAQNMAALLHTWSEHAQEDKEFGKDYEQLVENFWMNIGDSMREQVEETSACEGDGTHPLTLHAVFLLILKATIINGKKKDMKNVKLIAEYLDLEENTFAGENSSIPYQRCKGSLQQVATALVEAYVVRAQRQRCVPEVMSDLLPFYQHFHSRAMLDMLAERFEAAGLLELHERVLRAWLRGGAVRARSCVALAFVLLHYLSDDDQDRVLHSFMDLPIDVLELCLACALADTRRGAAGVPCVPCVPGVRRWLRSDAVAGALVRLCAREDDALARDIIYTALTQEDHGELLISDAAAEGVVVRLGEMLLQLTDERPDLLAPADFLDGDGPAPPEGDDPYKRLEERALQAGALLHALRDALVPRALPLLLTMLRLTVRIPRGAPQLSEDGWTRTLLAWRDAAARLPPAPRDRFVATALSYVHWHLLHNIENLDMDKIAHLASLCPPLALGGDLEPRRLVLHSRLVLDAAPAARDAPPSPHLLALQLGALWGAFCCDADDENDLVADLLADEAQLTPHALRVHGYNAVFRAVYVRDIILRRTHAAGGGWGPALLRVPYFLQQLAGVLHDLAVFAALADHYVFWSHYSIIHEVELRLARVLADVVSELPRAECDLLIDFLKKQAREHRYYWLYASHLYELVVSELRALRQSGTEIPWDQVFQVVSGSLHAGLSAERARWTAAQLRDVELRLHHEAQLRAIVPPREPDAPVVEVIDLHVFDQLQMSAAIVKRQRRRALQELRVQRALKLFDYSKLEAAELEDESVEWADTEQCVTGVQSLAMLVAYYKLCAGEAVDMNHFLSDFVSDNCKCFLDAVISGYYRHTETMLYERDLVSSPASWLHVASTAAVVQYLSVGPPRDWHAPAAHWDFTNITLCSVLATLALSRSLWRSVQMSLLARSTLELFCAVRRCVRAVPAEATRRQPAAHVAALPREWADIFGPDTHRSIYLYVAQVLGDKSPEIDAKQAATIEWLLEAVRLLDRRSTDEAARAGPLALEELLQRAAAALGDTCHHAFKYLAYYTLLAIAPSMVALDEKMLANRPAVVKEEEGEERLLAALSLSRYGRAFARLQGLVDAALASYEVCSDICEVAPRTDSYAVVLGYLLLALAAHHHAALAAGDLALQYVALFDSQQYIEGLVPAAVRLLPAAAGGYLAAPSAPFPKHLLPYFQRPPPLSLAEEASSGTVSRLACYALRCALAGGGCVAARAWWSALPPARAAALQRLVAAAVSPALIHHQLREVQRADAKELLGRDVVLSTNMQEMWAMCEREVEEATVSLRVCFSSCHPLKPPRVVAAAPAAPAACTDPHWLLVYLSYKNGRALEALRMWLSALGGWLEPALTCCVCYCRLHAADGSAPSVPCRRCRNPFHSRCLRRWFQKSSRSNCPVCRTNF